jgi:phospholipid/cholesterol/gamma-HCH transport system substrate-binding protein
MCESDENYVPLNDGYNWKGDPNATLSGQAIPQLPTGAINPAEGQPTAQSPPLAVAQYDPNTGTYLGPDGRPNRQTDLSRDANPNQSWQDMLLPPKGQ